MHRLIHNEESERAPAVAHIIASNNTNSIAVKMI